MGGGGGGRECVRGMGREVEVVRVEVVVVAIELREMDEGRVDVRELRVVEGGPMLDVAIEPLEEAVEPNLKKGLISSSSSSSSSWSNVPDRSVEIEGAVEVRGVSGGVSDDHVVLRVSRLIVDGGERETKGKRDWLAGLSSVRVPSTGSGFTIGGGGL